jgi:DNA topoisomerase-1
MTCTPSARHRPPSTTTAAPEAVPPGLVWVTDSEPGYRRVRRGDQVHYLDTRGKRLRYDATLARIRKLAIPPAY